MTFTPLPSLSENMRAEVLRMDRNHVEWSLGDLGTVRSRETDPDGINYRRFQFQTNITRLKGLKPEDTDAPLLYLVVSNTIQERLPHAILDNGSLRGWINRAGDLAAEIDFYPEPTAAQIIDLSITIFGPGERGQADTFNGPPGLGWVLVRKAQEWLNVRRLGMTLDDPRLMVFLQVKAWSLTCGFTTVLDPREEVPYLDRIMFGQGLF